MLARPSRSLSPNQVYPTSFTTLFRRAFKSTMRNDFNVSWCNEPLIGHFSFLFCSASLNSSLLPRTDSIRRDVVGNLKSDFFHAQTRLLNHLDIIFLILLYLELHCIYLNTLCERTSKRTWMWTKNITQKFNAEFCALRWIWFCSTAALDDFIYADLIIIGWCDSFIFLNIAEWLSWSLRESSKSKQAEMRNIFWFMRIKIRQISLLISHTNLTIWQ